jgi:hypothetical protein
MLSVETSRWAEFFGGRLTNTVFPKRITVTEEGIKTVKVRSLVVPWMREEEAMPFGKIVSVRHLKGIIWDTLVFETSGVQTTWTSTASERKMPGRSLRL